MNKALLPKLRTIDPHPIVHGGRPSILLRDPLRLTDQAVIIPQQMAPLLILCDGTRDISGLCASFAIRYGMRIGTGVMEQLVAALDDALLLDNERFIQAQEQTLEEYRQAAFRVPASAGRSYPIEADQTRDLLNGYLNAVDDESTQLAEIRGLVCPHIDYARGGAVYAGVWKRAASAVRAADVVVILGTDHYGSNLLTLTRQNYRTPFGVLPTAQDVVDHLAEAVGPETAFDGELLHRCEHSVELAAVWLHHARDGEPCETVPILCSAFGPFIHEETDPGQEPAFEALRDALEQATTGRRVFIVAAADLAHVGPAFGGAPQGAIERAQVQAADSESIAHMCAGDAAAFFEGIKRQRDAYNVCGLPAIYGALRLLAPVQGERTGYIQCRADEQDTSLVSICGVLWG
jgi:AmmeMemoRadiSam system protein B